MTKDKDIKTVVPALRFPEFRDAEGWRLKPLSEILDYERPDNYIVADTNYRKAGIPVLTANKSFVLGYTNENYGIYENLPVIIFDDFTVDKKYVDFPFKVKSSAIKILKPRNDNNLRFVYELMNCLKFEATEHKRYYISSYQTQMISSPKPAEQKKIANCLGSLDDLLSAVADKIEALKEHKKGLMQQLFPADGKTTPTLRFPEFQNVGEWKEKPMEEIFTIRNGYTPSRSNPDYWTDGTIPWFRMEDIRENGTILSDSIQHITPEAVKGNGLFPANSIIVATTATIGVHALIIVDSLANQQFTFLTKRKSLIDRLDMVYFYHYMFIVDEWCKKNINMGGLASVNMTSFKKLLIPIPKPAEQQRIADCLSSVDELISAEIDKLDQLKAHKKGLMQQLFPTLNE